MLLTAVATLDLAEPAAAAQAEHGWPAGRTARAVREYRRFLHLIAKYGEELDAATGDRKYSFIPSHDVDEVWRARTS